MYLYFHFILNDMKFISNLVCDLFWTSTPYVYTDVRGKQSLINSILIILEVGTNFVDLFYARVYIGHFYFCKIYLVTPK